MAFKIELFQAVNIFYKTNGAYRIYKPFPTKKSKLNRGTSPRTSPPRWANDNTIKMVL
jgi:hypothetical protein